LRGRVYEDGEGGDRYVKRDSQGWEGDFPMWEEVEDYAGKARVFVITCHEAGLGFTVRAVEEGRRGAGYEFAAYSETSPYSALGRLRQAFALVEQMIVTGAEADRQAVIVGFLGTVQDVGVSPAFPGVGLRSIPWSDVCGGLAGTRYGESTWAPAGTTRCSWS
jgi:hypothetical protein